MNAAVTFLGSVHINGVTVNWSTTKMRDEEDSEVGEDAITVHAQRPVSASAMRQAMSRVDALEKARQCERHLACPYTDASINVTGLDESGHVTIQIIRDGVPRGHGPAWEFAHLRPEEYSKAGELAMKSIGFIRDAANVLRSDGKTLAEMESAICGLRPAS